MATAPKPTPPAPAPAPKDEHPTGPYVTVRDEQMARSREIEEMGVTAWIVSHDSRQSHA